MSLPVGCLAGFLPVRLYFRTVLGWAGYLFSVRPRLMSRMYLWPTPNYRRIISRACAVADRGLSALQFVVISANILAVNYHASDLLRLVMSDVFCRCFQLRGALSDI